ncbi:MAG TPA: biopolymer transporter ExbD [Planctomycetota bacterium]|nr:biopolymer transporter ExbD [Planctomycetota bacterium]
MARRERHQFGLDDIPVASFSDIAFLLIVFFILTTTLVATRGLLTEFPSGERSEKQEKKTTTVCLHDGKLTLNDAEMDLPRLRQELADLKLYDRTGDDKVVILESAGKVEYRDYFAAMAAITQAGGTICIVRETGGER